VTIKKNKKDICTTTNLPVRKKRRTERTKLINITKGDTYPRTIILRAKIGQQKKERGRKWKDGGLRFAYAGKTRRPKKKTRHGTLEGKSRLQGVSTGDENNGKKS